jgi:hypothetical protein
VGIVRTSNHAGATNQNPPVVLFIHQWALDRNHLLLPHLPTIMYAISKLPVRYPIPTQSQIVCLTARKIIHDMEVELDVSSYLGSRAIHGSLVVRGCHTDHANAPYLRLFAGQRFEAFFAQQYKQRFGAKDQIGHGPRRPHAAETLCAEWQSYSSSVLRMKSHGPQTFNSPNQVIR